VALSITVIKAAAGVDYLLATVASADAARGVKGGIGAYYGMAGTPPARWIGAGAKAAGIPVGGFVSPVHANRLYKWLQHPLSGSPLDHRPIQLHPEDDRSPVSATQVSAVDLTFTIPKSVSLLFAVAGKETQDAILQAHHAAIVDVIEWAERQDVFQTRSGKGGVARAPVEGVIASRWDHWDSRTGDPHLHSHVVVSSRVRRRADGKWMALDTRKLFHAAVALSEVHTNILLDKLHRDLGMEFDIRVPSVGRPTRAVVADVVGVDPGLIDDFSSRALAVQQRLEEAIARWQDENPGHSPPDRLVGRWKDAAWAETRPAKDPTPRTLGERCATWREQITRVGFDPDRLVAASIGHTDRCCDPHRVACSDDVVNAMAQLAGREDGSLRGGDLALVALGDLQASQATWTPMRARAAVERVLRMVRCPDPQSRDRLTQKVCQRVVEIGIELEPSRYQPTVEAVDDERLVVRGAVVFDDPDRARKTTPAIWNAESRLEQLIGQETLHTSRLNSQEARDAVAAASIRNAATRGFQLAPDQMGAAVVAVSQPRAISCVVGPAGSGKTTLMRTVRQAWEAKYGPGSVVGLATSAVAADVLSADLDAPAQTVAKWLYETGAERKAERHQLIREVSKGVRTPKKKALLAQLLAQQATFQTRPGQLIIVDEASMTGTLSLDMIAQRAQAAGVRMLLVGDPRQLDAVDAGGVLGWADRAGHAAQLESLFRFEDPQEAKDSLGLRRGSPSAIDRYMEAGRIREGTSQEMIDGAYSAWMSHAHTGQAAVLIAATNDLAWELAHRASLDLRAAGVVDSSRTCEIRGKLDAGLGERVLSRETNRKIKDRSGQFVRNGTTMQIQAIDTVTGVVTAIREDNGELIDLEASWVAGQVELAYAVTAHRAQGITVDHCHLAISASEHLSRELFYVAMTRGRKSNTAWIATLSEEEAAAVHVRRDEIPGVRDRLEAILATDRSERTAHEIAAGHAREGYSLGRLLREHEYLGALVSRDRFRGELGRANLEVASEVEASPAFDSLVAAWRRAATLDWGGTWMALSRPVEDPGGGDVAMILQSRMARIVEEQAMSLSDPGWLAGVEPVIRTEDEGVSLIVRQNESMIRNRLDELRGADHPWVADLGPRPANPRAASQWDEARLAAAIYRDTWGVETIDVIGPRPVGRHRQAAQWEHVRALLSAHDWVAQPPDHMVDDDRHLSLVVGGVRATTAWHLTVHDSGLASPQGTMDWSAGV